MLAVNRRADGKLEVPCRLCKRTVQLVVTLEPASLKLEAECPKCFAYEMVRLSPDEVPVAIRGARC